MWLIEELRIMDRDRPHYVPLAALRILLLRDVMEAIGIRIWPIQ